MNVAAILAIITGAANLAAEAQRVIAAAGSLYLLIKPALSATDQATVEAAMAAAGVALASDLAQLDRDLGAVPQV